MSRPLLNFEPAALLVDYRIQDDGRETAQRAALRPASFFNSRPELAEMKLYPARPATR